MGIFESIKGMFNRSADDNQADKSQAIENPGDVLIWTFDCSRIWCVRSKEATFRTLFSRNLGAPEEVLSFNSDECNQFLMENDRGHSSGIIVDFGPGDKGDSPS